MYALVSAQIADSIEFAEWLLLLQDYFRFLQHAESETKRLDDSPDQWLGWSAASYVATFHSLKGHKAETIVSSRKDTSL